MNWWIVSLCSLLPLAAAAQQPAGATVGENEEILSGRVAAPAAGSLETMAPSYQYVPDTLVAEKHQETRYERHTHHYRNAWYRLIPNQITAQFAGSIGVASLGVGWHYGKRKSWETELLLGYLPKFNSEENKATFTIKERYVPWHPQISSRWVIEPLTTGLFFNSIFGEGFWSKEPSKYPKRYYGFSTRVRLNVFLGQRITYRIPSKNRHFFRSISAYYELSTCDMYVISALPNKNVKASDILSLAFGLRFSMF